MLLFEVGPFRQLWLYLLGCKDTEVGKVRQPQSEMSEEQDQVFGQTRTRIIFGALGTHTQMLNQKRKFSSAFGASQSSNRR